MPSNHLPQLSKRLDAEVPHLTEARVLPTMANVVDFINHHWHKIKAKYQSNNDSDCPIRKRFA